MTNYIDKSNEITEGLCKSFQNADCKIANRQMKNEHVKCPFQDIRMMLSF